MLFTQPWNSTLPASIAAMEEAEIKRRIAFIKMEMGRELFIPGHHYQRKEVMAFTDTAGDSLQLAQVAAANKDARYIVFCGVHFMAETADILTSAHQTVILPDRRAGCSMADMATITQTTTAWDKLQNVFGDTIIPLTYVNSTAAIKAFVGRHHGATVTSSNAHQMVTWALQQKERILFLPDQHLGRNTAFDIGIPLEQMAVWDPITQTLEYDGEISSCRIILWKGHCSVHEKFTVQNVLTLREKDEERKIIVHPECSREVVALADENGSTKKIIDCIQAAEKGSKWAIGTEMNLVQRLIDEHPDLDIISLNPSMCPCLTMNRIDLPHLLWALESVYRGDPVNVVTVDSTTSQFAIQALERMLERV